MLFWLAVAWIMLTPYATGALVARVPGLRRAVGRNLAVATTLGWTALATLFAGVIFVGGHDGMSAALAAAPFGGLAFWVPSQEPEERPDEPSPQDVPPSGDSVHWGRLAR